MIFKVVFMEDVVGCIVDGVIVIVFFFFGFGCLDKILEVIGDWFDREGYLRNFIMIYLIVVGDMYGIKGIDYIVKDGLLLIIIVGFYFLGFFFLLMLDIWVMLVENCVVVYNVFFGILFDMYWDVVVCKFGVMIKVGLDIFVDLIC